MKPKEISVTEASRHFAELIDATRYRKHKTILLKNKVPVAMIIPVPTPNKEYTCGDLLKFIETLPRLNPKEGESLANDIKRFKQGFKKDKALWA